MSYPARMISRTRTAVSGKNILRLSNGQIRRYHQAGNKPVFHWEVCLSVRVVDTSECHSLFQDPQDLESQLSEDEIAIRYALALCP